MESQNLQVLKNLINDKDFAAEMDKNVDNALKNAGFNLEPEFAGKLKAYGKSNGFSGISNSALNNVNDSMVSSFGLESRW